MAGSSQSDRYDVAVIGGGFYGCCVALFMRSLYERVVVIERGPGLMQRASAVNQARVHGGFHYPRNFVTALRSIHNFPRFVELFRPAIVDDFQMLYGIARHGSKINANRFARMFEAMGAQFAPASASQAALFDRRAVEAVFACREHGFDWTILRDILTERLAAASVEVRCSTEVTRVAAGEGGAPRLDLTDGDAIHADTVFNAAYSEINALLTASGLETLPFKHEWTEVALIQPPADFAGVGVTVMDGPFFSTMPYPAASAYSLTHVRYTPHYSWTDRAGGAAPSRLFDTLPRRSRWYQMVADARRYMPSLEAAAWKDSLFEVKTLMTRNEGDDGRPILFHRHPGAARLYSVLGGKIDNIFDLFDVIKDSDPAWAQADLRHLGGA